MTEPENFLQRWSKRKLSNGEQAPDREELPAPNATQSEPEAPGHAAAAAEDKPFDLASLPSIESIDANTDVTAFLRPGVPPELSRAALRRAWSADPAIRDFVGLVENGWDFNDPQAMPGFGPITPSEVARLAAQLLGQLPASDSATPVEQANKPALTASETPKADTVPSALPQRSFEQEVEEPADAKLNDKNAAPQKESDG
jgi:uncharacterized protein DUF3306